MGGIRLDTDAVAQLQPLGRGHLQSLAICFLNECAEYIAMTLAYSTDSPKNDSDCAHATMH